MLVNEAHLINVLDIEMLSATCTHACMYVWVCMQFSLKNLLSSQTVFLNFTCGILRKNIYIHGEKTDKKVVTLSL